ncbi:MAG: apolipoprotein N-acyltransferase [Saprospiraceae bacterium]|nr:apolipoprotein N-acyltransferase [Saprospiraceae bacterium]
MKHSKIILISSLLLLLLAAWLGYDMVRLGREELLWGHRPLFFLLGAWGAVVLWWILGRSARKMPISWRRLGLANLGALLLSLGFPGFLPFPFLLFVGFIPLLLLEKELSSEPKARWSLFGYSYATFVLWNIITTYWVANSALLAGMFAIFVNSLLMTLPILAFQATKKILPKWADWSFVVYWISYELLHYHWDLAWPWLTLGNGFAAVPSLVQWYEYTGVFGGTAWVLAMNLLLLKAWEYYRSNKTLSKPLMYRSLTLAFLPMAISLALFYTYEEAEDVIEVVVVQPNYEPHYEKFAVPEREQVQQFVLLAKNKLTPETDYLVFPETSFGLVETSVVNSYPSIERIRAELVDYPELKIITGLNAYYKFQPGEQSTGAVREYRPNNGSQGFRYETYNLAAQLTIGVEEVQMYKKSKLVPGAEIFPFKNLVPFMEPLVKQLGGTTAGLGTQKKRSPLVSETARIAPVICYESVFGDYFTGYVRPQSLTAPGSNAAFIMTNDGWWDNTPGHRQHLYYASLRAIETRRSIARSANTGVSAFVDQRGIISQPTQYDEAIAIRGDINLNDKLTFYVKWGDLIARISLFLAGLLMMNTVAKTWLKRVGKE